MPILTTDRIGRGTNGKYVRTSSEMRVKKNFKKACAINKQFTEFDSGRERRKPQISNAQFFSADEDDENTHMEWETNQSQKMPIKRTLAGKRLKGCSPKM